MVTVPSANAGQAQWCLRSIKRKSSSWNRLFVMGRVMSVAFLMSGSLQFDGAEVA